MKEIKGGNITSQLTRLSVLVMMGVPLQTLVEMLAEVVDFLDCWQKNTWMPCKQVVKAGGSPLLRANHKKIWQRPRMTPTKSCLQVP